MKQAMGRTIIPRKEISDIGEARSDITHAPCMKSSMSLMRCYNDNIYTQRFTTADSNETRHFVRPGIPGPPYCKPSAFLEPEVCPYLERDRAVPLARRIFGHVESYQLFGQQGIPRHGVSLVFLQVRHDVQDVEDNPFFGAHRRLHVVTGPRGVGEMDASPRA